MSEARELGHGFGRVVSENPEDRQNAAIRVNFSPPDLSKFDVSLVVTAASRKLRHWPQMQDLGFFPSLFEKRGSSLGKFPKPGRILANKTFGF